MIRSWSLSDFKAARRLGFFWGLGLCFRPADVLFFFFVPVLSWVAESLRSAKLAKKDLFVWSAAVTPFVYFFFQGKNGAAFETVVISCLPALLLFGFRKKIGLNSAFSQAILIAFVSMTLWYAPAMGDLYQWIAMSVLIPPRNGCIRAWPDQSSRADSVIGC